MSIDITPQDLGDAARDFRVRQTDMENAWVALRDALDAQAGMAGDDDPAHTFAAKYQSALDALWKAFGAAVVTLGGVSLGLTATANNYIKAEQHSTHGESNHPPPLLTPEPVAAYISVSEPASALGGGHGGPPGPLGKLWPDADPDRLRAAASAFRAARGSVDTVGKALHGTIQRLTDANRTGCMVALEGFWQGIAKPGDNTTVLTGLSSLCAALADACARYAKEIDNAHDKMRSALIAAGIAVGVTTVVGIALTVFTLGGSDAGAAAADAAEAAAILGPIVAETVSAVAAETEAAVAADLVTTVEAAAVDVPTVEVVEAETTEIEAALDEELADAEGEVNPARTLSRGDLNPGQARNFNRFVKKLPAASEEPTITRLPDGSVQLQAKVPGRVPGSYALYTKIVDAEGNTIGYTKTTVLPDGTIAHVKNKMVP